MKNPLITIIENGKFENDKLYLLESKFDKYGFFYYNDSVFFGTITNQTKNTPPIITNHLELHSNIRINSIQENQTFKTGNYDLIKYKGDLKTEVFDLLYRLCSNYAEDQNGMTLFDFFSTIRELFEEDPNRNINLIGTVGELILIKEIYEKYEKDLSVGWHNTGNFSKFDFSFNKFNIEVKTTIKDEKKFLIKHSQLFNSQKIFVAIVSLIETGTNYTLNNLVDYFSQNTTFKNNIRFHIALAKELTKVKDPADLDRGFSLKGYTFIDKDILETIQNIPSKISNITYNYDFNGVQNITPETIFQFL